MPGSPGDFVTVTGDNLGRRWSTAQLVPLRSHTNAAIMVLRDLA